MCRCNSQILWEVMENTIPPTDKEPMQNKTSVLLSSLRSGVNCMFVYIVSNFLVLSNSSNAWCIHFRLIHPSPKNPLFWARQVFGVFGTCGMLMCESVYDCVPVWKSCYRYLSIAAACIRVVDVVPRLWRVWSLHKITSCKIRQTIVPNS